MQGRIGWRGFFGAGAPVRAKKKAGDAAGLEHVVADQAEHDEHGEGGEDLFLQFGDGQGHDREDESGAVD
jgi:hypothetical protein